MRPFMVGIGGGTGSGKTTTARKITDFFGPAAVVLIDADAYYRDLSHLPCEKRHTVNFDHPSAMDADLLADHLQQVKRGLAIQKPIYDFTCHIRTGATTIVEPRPIVITEGILIFVPDGVRCLFDLRVFIDEDADIRLLRRTVRDINVRGRSIAAIADQYLKSVRPMHSRFIEPGKADADMVLRSGDAFTRLVAVLKKHV
jgi:uridine kinase